MSFAFESSILYCDFLLPSFVTRCPYKAIQPSHLKRHLQTHGVAIRFTCELCSYSANTESHLKSHYLRNHEGEVVVPGDGHVTEGVVTSSTSSRLPMDGFHQQKLLVDSSECSGKFYPQIREFYPQIREFYPQIRATVFVFICRVKFK